MSRRHTSTVQASLSRTVGAALATLLAAAALLPVTAAAQDGDRITPPMIQQTWQLLTQRNENGRLENVPAGVGATMLLRSNAAFGEAACSTYDASYEQTADVLSVFVEPDEIVWRECDPEAREFDEQFYRNLDEIASIGTENGVPDDVLRVNDVIGEPLMVFTRAEVDQDPTASRWSLARIGDADGSVEPVIQGISPWIEFLRGGSVVGNAGCGSFLGKYAVNEGRIDITDIHYRLQGCVGAARPQAERMLETLSEVTDFQVRPAGLALLDDNGIIRLALEPELDVASRTWTPTAIFDARGQEQHAGNVLSTSAIQFLGPDYEGRSICRPFGGEATRSGLAIDIPDGKTEFIGGFCKGKAPGGLQLGDIEAAFVTALEDAASYALRGDELTLIDVDGVVRAVLEPQPPLTGTTWAVFTMTNGKRLVQPVTDVPITATFADVDAAAIGLLQGNTGVSNQDDTNTYFGTYSTPMAARIVVDPLSLPDKGCDRKQNQKKAPCKNEQRFVKLLEQANVYIVRDEDLKFYKNRKPLMVLRPLRLVETDE